MTSPQITPPRTTYVLDAPLPKGYGPPTHGKYKAAFAKLKPGNCIEVPSADLGFVRAALMRHIECKRTVSKIAQAYSVTYQSIGDGKALVWLVDNNLKARGKKCQAKAN